ncbi:hypothetical protein SAMN06265365_1359 [Tistlia consotensis]|uniref:SGNH/GDSL hydrolase family protein n=1 Tax=Tistlia consotensis USBA 355 TaxID=560819 RepID=A0A1Y6CPI0_9PROT|nr:hypothetical protein SAMN05428998_14042 [Tistlia consotensis USBA 355]SNS16465.1 hypothetical protein SAMN06265365_1359 [Tistlia consotensis]
MLVVGLLLAGGFLAADGIVRRLIRDLAIAPEEFVGREAGGRYAVNDLLTVRPGQVGRAAVMFSDSTNDSVPPSDPDKRTLTGMLRDDLAPAGIAGYGVSFPGAGMDWIVTLLHYWTERFPGLDYAVLPINLRWASPAWRGLDLNDNARRPLEFYAASQRLLPWLIDLGYHSPPVRADHLAKTAGTVIGPVPFDIATVDADDFAESRHVSLHAAKRELHRLRFALAYGNRLAADDPIFHLIDRARAICRARGLRCLFVLPPFNETRLGELSPPVAAVLKANVDLVRRHFDGSEAPLLDLSATLPPERFHDVVNEHVDWQGRRFIAGCVAGYLIDGRSGAGESCPGGTLVGGSQPPAQQPPDADGRQIAKP